jgi:hypothetical protein
MKSKFNKYKNFVKNKSVFDRKLPEPKALETKKNINYDYLAMCFFMIVFVFLFFYSILRDLLKIFFNVPVQ